MTLAEVLARHLSYIGQEDCVDCAMPWPCDAVQMARQLIDMTAERDALAEDEQSAQERVTRLESLLGEDHVGRTFHALDGHKRPYGYQQKSEPPDGGTERSDHCRMDARFFLRALLASISAPEET